MNILLLKGYNNYFNRILRKHNTISEYKAAVVDGNDLNYYDLANVNFNPNDGVITSHIIGVGDLVWDPNIGENDTKREGKCTPDYCLVYEPRPDAQGGPYIHSRWFVKEVERTRKGQYKLALIRDVKADYENIMMKSPCFVEKGMINSVNNPLLLNSEGMRFNQIKQSEDFIKDDSHCAWLVGYVKKNIDSSDLTNVNPINYTTPGASANIIDADDLSWEECIQYFDTKGLPVNNTHKDCFWFYNTDVSFRTRYEPNYTSVLVGNVRTTFTENFQLLYNSTDFPNEDWDKLNSVAFNIPDSHKVNDREAALIASRIFATTRDNDECKNKFKTMLDAGKAAQFNADTILVNEDIRGITEIIKDNKVYELEISIGEDRTTTQYLTGNDSTATAWMTTVASKINYLDYNTSNQSRKKLKLDYRGKYFTIVAREKILSQTLSFNFPVSVNRNNCTDATYDMFAMPIDPKALGLTVTSDPVVVKYVDGNDDEQIIDISSISETQLLMATVISTKLGAGTGTTGLNYDLQLLPYCPIEDLNPYYNSTIYGPTYDKYVLDVENLTSLDYTMIYNNEATPEPMGIIFYPKHANFSKTINYSVPNETVHYTYQTIVDPIFTYNNSLHDGLPVWRFAGFPYKVTDGVWDLDIEEAILPDILVEADYISLTVSTGLQSPQILFTNSTLPLTPVPSQQITIEGNLGVKAHWILPDNPTDVKIKNECDMYRLVSPNFNSIYEFKKTKLRNGIKSFNIDCTYKPFTPYIKVNPNYDDSYYAVQDFNDSMGLILGGDFSIPMLSDAWINYELGNRNYQNIFNRSIQNLDVNQQIAKEQQQFHGAIGILGGGVAGAVAGSKAGPYGAIAGAAVGTAAGAIGYGLDRDWLLRQQEETRSFAVDNFNYQLGNVQALNATITKSNPLTYNNKVWPILEYYSCTDKEKEVLEQKIKYDGMTIMAIDTLNNYVTEGGYVKGKMIRLENLKDDSHVADAIYEEVDKGFYVKGE